MIKLEQISLPIKFDDEEVKRQICKTLKIFPNSIDNFEILKLSVDARKKPNIKYVATFGVSLKGNMEKKFSNLTFEKQSYLMKYQKKKTDKKVVIVGFGPSGMFAGLTLAKMGLKPLIIEQGKMVDERARDVEEF